MRPLLVILIALTSILGFAQNADSIRVRLYSDKEVTGLKIRVANGHYAWVATTQQEDVFDTISDASSQRAWLHDIQPHNEELVINRVGRPLGRYSRLRLVPLTDSASFLMAGPGNERLYQGGLDIQYLNGKLLVIGVVSMDSYLAGVVESEGGHATEYEYFRAQAVLARTWLIANYNKHSSEGYNVKDDVSSQAYYSMAYLQNSAQIVRAVRETKDTILVDSKGKPVLGVFHSNSGGRTANSEDAWSGTIPYLRSVPDTFSIEGSKATWRVEINKEDFVNYVARKMGISPANANFRVALLEYKNPTREGTFSFQSKQMKWRDVRTHFRLRSTWFNVEEAGDKVILHGRGFGHGVGMSQEGAMIMARYGYDYREILQFYFKGTSFLRL